MAGCRRRHQRPAVRYLGAIGRNRAERLARVDIEKVAPRNPGIIRLLVNLARGQIESRKMRRIQGNIAAKQLTEILHVRFAAIEPSLSVVGANKEATAPACRVQHGIIALAHAK